MLELVKYIAQSLVDNPDEVKVNEVEGEKSIVLELSVAKEDMGKVIGKQGAYRQSHKKRLLKRLQANRERNTW